ncbi:MAG: restriction endonuclease [Methanobacteriaceae archaeon]|jgi:hypothetical protein|nr:restriction endonuclease [Candidatus Methanorudis spinitermitis]
MEKPQFVNFIVTILEESGFKVYGDFKAFEHIIDIYAVLPTIIGDFTIAISCKNYEEEWKVGLDIVKEMEMVGRVLKVSKVVIATTSNFSPQAKKYASEKKVKLLDRDSLIILAKKFSKEHTSLYDEKNSYENSKTVKDTYDYNQTDLKSQYSNKQYKNKINSLNSSKRIPSGGKKNSDPQPLRFKSSENSNIKSSSGILNKENIGKGKKPVGSKIKSIFNNTIFLIVLVVTISYLISFIIYKVASIPVGIQGLIKIFSSLILSYGLVYIINPKGTAVFIKGTVIFLISIVITILMIIFL